MMPSSAAMPRLRTSFGNPATISGFHNSSRKDCSICIGWFWDCFANLGRTGKRGGTKYASLCLYVITEEHILIADVQFAVGNDGMRPGRQLGAVGLLEAATLE